MRAGQATISRYPSTCRFAIFPSRTSLLKRVSQIESSGVEPSRIILEINRDGVMRDFEMAVEALELLQAAWRPDRARRWRHGLFQPGLRPPAAARQDQDRPQLPGQYRNEPGVVEYRQDRHRPVAQSRPHMYRGGYRTGPRGAILKTLGCRRMQELLLRSPRVARSGPRTAVRPDAGRQA